MARVDANITHQSGAKVHLLFFFFLLDEGGIQGLLTMRCEWRLVARCRRGIGMAYSVRIAYKIVGYPYSLSLLLRNKEMDIASAP